MDFQLFMKWKMNIDCMNLIQTTNKDSLKCVVRVFILILNLSK